MKLNKNSPGVGKWMKYLKQKNYQQQLFFQKNCQIYFSGNSSRTTTGGTPYDRFERGRLLPIGKECFVGDLNVSPRGLS